MKKLFCLLTVVCIFTFSFIIPASASDNSWEEAYYNKLIEIREKPGFIKRILTDKDSNGFIGDIICYALTDYNQDNIPELIVYGVNGLNEAGDNYQIYTYKGERIKKFDIINNEGPYGENVSFSSQPYWPYYTNFFFMPEGYIRKESKELVWFMNTKRNNCEYWSIAGTPNENETIFEVKFDFEECEIEVIPEVYSENKDTEEYQFELDDWQEKYELSVSHDEYGRLIPNENTVLWQQLLEIGKKYGLKDIDENLPKMTLENKILIGRNNLVHSERFWLLLWVCCFILVTSVIVVLSIMVLKNIDVKENNKKPKFYKRSKSKK